ncbi:MAG: serine hydrolase [Pseudomonadota bacterium]
MIRVLKWFGFIALAALIGAVGYLSVMPPDLLRVGSNYTAKIICSNVFIANRDEEEVLEVDVQAPGHPLLRLMRVEVDRSEGTVHAALLGAIAPGMAVSRGPKLGCTSLPSLDGSNLLSVDGPPVAEAPVPQRPWPVGEQVDTDLPTDVSAILNDETLVGPGMRAVVIVKDGNIIGERYGEGFNAQSPLLGWSVTKTVTAALIGRAIREGHMTLEGNVSSVFDWADERQSIGLSELMAMASDLQWNEGYGSVSDVTRMLYLEEDMAAFVAGMPVDAVTSLGIGEDFNYSSGTTVLLSKIWQSAFTDQSQAVAFAHQALFQPLGMHSAVLEMDAKGTYVGSSYMYATARDWARFGQFMLQRGVWDGLSLLPIGFVDWMTKTHPASNEQYGNGQIWKRAANAWMPGENPQLPDDGFYMNGHDGQSISVISSEGLVVVRLGLTPTDRAYKVAYLLEALIEATGD